MAREIVFVFGSNLAGRHGKGAALEAVRHWGAKYGVGEGRTGKAYAIPTKDSNLRTLPLCEIQQAYVRFAEYASRNPDIQFLVTPAGTGLAGYSLKEIRPFARSFAHWRNMWFTGDWFHRD